MPLRSAATAIFLKSGEDNLLIDCAGGHEIIGRFDQAGIAIKDLKNIFISHSDSDHILGIVPLVRAISRLDTKINLILSQPTYDAVKSLFTIVAKKHWDNAQKNLNVVIVNDGVEFATGNISMSFIETGTKGPMLGTKIILKNGFSIFYPGDEPIQEKYFEKISGIDLLLHEAFCLDKDIAKFDPHGKNHSSAKEAAQRAALIHAKSLVLFHMEDETLTTRQAEYYQESAEVYKGQIIVPLDLQELDLESII
jgi:ribonuclease Z